jgi:hypothetical protein
MEQEAKRLRKKLNKAYKALEYLPQVFFIEPEEGEIVEVEWTRNEDVVETILSTVEEWELENRDDTCRLCLGSGLGQTEDRLCDVCKGQGYVLEDLR